MAKGDKWLNIDVLADSMDSLSETTSTKVASDEQVYFSINSGADGRFSLSLEKGTAGTVNVTRTNTAVTQNILHQWHTHKQRSMNSFSWGEDHSSSLMIDEHPDFLDLIISSPLVLKHNNKKRELKRSTSTEGEITLNVTEEQEDGLKAALTFHSDGEEYTNPLILSPRHVLASNTLFSNFPGWGVNYARFSQFTGRLNEDDLEFFLSLFCTHFPDREVRFKDYSFYQKGEVTAQRALRFTSLDEEGNLHISLLWDLSSLPTEQVNRGLPRRVVAIDHKEKRLKSSSVTYATPHDKGLVKLIRKYVKGGISTGDEEFFIPAGQALDFLSENLGWLAGTYSLFGTEALEKYKLKHVAPQPQIRLTSGIDFFEAQCSLEVGDELIPLNRALELYEENNYIPLSDGNRGIVDKTFFDRLIRVLGKVDKNNVAKVSFFDLPLIDMIIDGKTEDGEFIKNREVFEGFNRLNSHRLPKNLIKGELRDYQKFGVKWFSYLKENHLGGCLADDMGLGKTVQTISLLASDKDNSQKLPSLIVMPRSLLTNWKREIEKFAPHLSSYIYHGTERDFDRALEHRVILTTYALVRNDIEKMQNQRFRFAVLDEIQAIKNINAHISKAVMLLDADYRFGLSGTPMENHVGEIYSVFRFINPAMFGSQADFNRRYLNPIQNDGDRHAAELLAKKLSPFILRRLKQDVAKDLPPRTEQVLYAEMGKEQSALYEERRHYYQNAVKNTILEGGMAKASFFILQGLLELRQLATIPEAKTEGEITSAKWPLLLDQMSEVIDGGHRCLVFTNFLATVDILSEKLADQGIEHLIMTGSTTNRADLVDRFQNSQRYKVFLMTLKSGGVGLNLTGADYVYILDPWWNRSAEQQAIDRTHRIGQTRNIFSYRMIAKGTIEEKILELQEKKNELFDALISSDGQVMKKLTEEDIDYLLAERSGE